MSVKSVKLIYTNQDGDPVEAQTDVNGYPYVALWHEDGGDIVTIAAEEDISSAWSPDKPKRAMFSVSEDFAGSTIAIKVCGQNQDPADFLNVNDLAGDHLSYASVAAGEAYIIPDYVLVWPYIRFFSNQAQDADTQCDITIMYAQY